MAKREVFLLEWRWRRIMMKWHYVIMLLAFIFTFTYIRCYGFQLQQNTSAISSGEWQNDADASAINQKPGNQLQKDNSINTKELYRIMRDAVLELGDQNSKDIDKKKLQKPKLEESKLKKVTRIMRVPAQALTNTALSYLGVPYQWAGITSRGFDCSGFIWKVFQKHGLSLPRTADLQYAFGRNVQSDNLRTGDLVFFSTYASGPSHVGLYLGKGRFVHSAYSGGVRVDSIRDSYYKTRYIGAKRFAISGKRRTKEV